MEPKEIIKKFDDLLANKKTRGFISHLVKSYLPVNTVGKVFLPPKGDFKCAITNQQLISIDEVISGMHSEEYKENFFKFLHNMMDQDVEVETPIKSLFGDRKLAVQGTNTTTFMALPTYHL